ncbi:hypothetical protein MSLAZ_2295 [Methanosarcina lacustris Z-7289]|uniref:Uncharacterized protein n=1 Tax=Methanosarcina lacustris Z-7289 TaxID=1434111 RepID=A0A0E3S5B2_9EURY|nr:hypothetical protein MSLAZ_2295 [Methanosarcina lacustris Z-7289]
MFGEWKEDQSGYNDEVTTTHILKVSSKDHITLHETSEYFSCAPKNGGRSKTEKTFTISIEKLKTLIKENCETQNVSYKHP